MPPVSQAQRAAMHAAAEGKSTLGIPQSVGREFAQSDPGGKLPERKQEGGGIHYQKPSASFRKEHPTTSQGPQSAQQRRLVWATVHGADTGMPSAVAERFARSDAPGKLPKYVGKQAGGDVADGREKLTYQPGQEPIEIPPESESPLWRPKMGFAMRVERPPSPPGLTPDIGRGVGLGYGYGQQDPGTARITGLEHDLGYLRAIPGAIRNVLNPPSTSQAYTNLLPIHNRGEIELSSQFPRQTMAQIRGDPLTPQEPSFPRDFFWPPGSDIGSQGGISPDRMRSGGATGLGVRPRLQGGGLGSIGRMTSADMPYWTRAEARIDDQSFGGGLIPSSGAGRTDQLPLAVATESHVIPAAEMSGLGQGNSLAGARLLSTALKIGPWGSTPLPGAGLRGRGPPAPPQFRFPREPGEPGTPYVTRQEGGEVMPSEGLRAAEERDVDAYQRMLGLGARPRQAGGSSVGSEGGARRETSILAAGGEFVIPRHSWLQYDEHGQLMLHAGVEDVGEGDIHEGHERLNQMIMNIRKHTIKFLKSAPAPKS